MKKLGLIIVLLCTILSVNVFAQSGTDVVYLKNGDILKCKIMKDIPNDYIQIEMKDKSVRNIKHSEIEKIERNSSFSKSEEEDERRTSFGLKTGMSYATLIGEDASGSEFQSGLVLGGFLNFPIDETVSIQPELLYAQHGAKDGSGSSESSITANVIAVPVLLVLDLPTGESSKFSIYPGFGFAFNFSTEFTYTQNGSEKSVDISDEMEPLIIFSTVGASFETRVSENLSLVFDLRANTSATSLMKDLDKVNDLSLYFMVGIKF